jgi:hypothetical protein
MGFYVRLDEIDDELLQLAGFVRIAENEKFIIYSHFGDDVIVNKHDPFVIVDDVNDAAMLGSDIIPMPPENGH